jgi:outer membrane protein assembly factor BamD
MTMGAVRAAVAVAALLAVACASGPRRPPAGAVNPDRFLFERGTEALKERRWLTAREYFRELIDTYPQSPHRAEAKLGLADSYFGEGTAESKVLALNEYREFLTFFPTHPRADYAQFRLAMVHFSQMLSPQRDQTETKEAIRELELFIQRYPNSPLLGEARQKLREAKDRLGQHDYEVGLYYYRIKWYPGAIDRFRELLERDPEFTYRDAVYFHLAESLLRINRPAEALPYYERILKEFVKSEYLEDASRRIAELKGKKDAANKQA